jgi:hypothetical protein
MRRTDVALAGAALLVVLVAPLQQQADAAGTVTVTDRVSAAGLSTVMKPSWSACETPGGLLYVGFHQKSSALYQANGNGAYTTVPIGNAWPLATPSTVVDRHGCAWADFDGDGDLDMANSAGRNQSNFVKPSNRDNELYLRQANGTYVDVGTQMGVGDPCTRGRHMTAADYTGDGRPDFFVGAAIPRNDSRDPCNSQPHSEEPHLFVNRGDQNGDGTWDGFTLHQSFGNDDPGQRCAESFDADGDGDIDILGCRLKSKPPEIWANNGTGTFTLRSGTASGLTSAVSDAIPYDMDSDGDLDIVEVRKSTCGWQPNDGTGRFGAYRTTTTFSSGEGRSVAVGVTGAGLTVYCQVQASSSNPTDYVSVLSGTTWTRYAVPNTVGLADEVYAVHPSGPTGPVEFLVLNGGNGGESGSGGFLQLIRVTSS